MNQSGVSVVELSARDLRLIRNALVSFLSDFGHDEADVVADIQRLLVKLPTEPIETAAQG